MQLKIGEAVGQVDITAETPLLEPSTSSIGTTVTPKQISDLPVNGRNYLDLLQLVPGVAINRQADPEGDNATPVLGNGAEIIIFSLTDIRIKIRSTAVLRHNLIRKRLPNSKF